MTAIENIIGRRVWDSRGNPTIEVEITLENGKMGRAIAPAGASRGTREAIDLRDGGQRLRGMDVQKALYHLNHQIAPEFMGKNIEDQATSLAFLHASAANLNLPLWQRISQLYDRTPSLPLPEIQIFGGGAHAGRRVDIQDFMVMVPGAKSFDEVMEITNEIYFVAGELMKAKGKLAGVADEGGWWPNFGSNEEALETLVHAIEKAGEKPGDRVVISLDIAASEFGKNGQYKLALEDRDLSSTQLIELLGQWIADYPIASIEDPLGEDDPEGMIEFTKRFGDKVQIIGDDFLVTNAKLVAKAQQMGACNAVLIKVNQAGTISEAIAAFEAASQQNWRSIVSARSGETEDVSISHLAVGLGAGQLKVGSFTRSERMAKWNEVLRIQEQFGADAFVQGAPLHNTCWAAL